MKICKRKGLMFFAVLMLFTQTSFAHQTSTSYLTLSSADTEQSTQYHARWEISLVDLELAVGLDTDRNGQILWQEVLAQLPAIQDYMTTRMHFRRLKTECTYRTLSPQLDRKHTGVFLSLPFTLYCEAGQALTLHYNVLFDRDSNHRGFVVFKNGQHEQVYVSSPEQPSISFSETRTFTFFDYILSGIHHIAIGYDHLLFLLALLLPSVLLRKNGRWLIQPSLKPVMIDTLKIVSCFTFAHSLTLIAATQHWLNMEASLVEFLIAATVVFAGLHIFYPIMHRQRWLLALVFGLIHGFGFAGVLSEVPVSTEAFWIRTLGFNIGVEIGQVLIVALLLPLLFFIRQNRIYIRGVIPAGAVFLVSAGTYWMLERGITI